MHVTVRLASAVVAVYQWILFCELAYKLQDSSLYLEIKTPGETKRCQVLIKNLIHALTNF